MALDYINKYEIINNKIKNDIKQSFESINDKRYVNIIPLSRREIKKEITKESEPILFSLKNKIKYSTIENNNEIMFFRLTEHNFDDVKNNLFYIKTKINEINNKIKVLQDKNLFERISINKTNKYHSQKYLQIITKENEFLRYYEKIKNNISFIENNQEELLIKMKNHTDENKENIDLLNNMKENIELLIENTKSDINKKLISVNETNKKCCNLNEINTIKDYLNSIKKNVEEMNDDKKYIKISNEIKININKLKAQIENGINNKIKLSLKENNEILQNIIKNNNKISNLKNNTLKILEKTKEFEKIISDIRISSLSKIIINNMNSEMKKEIYNFNQNKILLDYEFKILFENIEKAKKILSNATKKLDFHKFIKDSENLYNKMNNYFVKEFAIVEENKNYYTNLILVDIISRKNKVDKIKKEKKIINSRLEELQSLIEQNINNKNKNKQYILEMENNLNEHNNIIKKIKIFNNNIIYQKKEINSLNNKITEIENFIKNMTIDNIYYQNNLRKSINNYFYENKIQTNDVERHKLLNRTKTNNLNLYLENLNKTIINNKKSLENQINIFINKQNGINKRSKEYINYNNKTINKNKIENIKKIKFIKDKINKIIKIFIKINDNNKDTKEKIRNLQELLIKKESKIDEELYNIKFYLKEKIKNLNI